ncbi:hypothetical protein ATZ36_02635 [Candidatus Endomicrobiellum trichonymphae]|jgi:hypothetical protein|uniref:Uncharacterized protein n=1 Tax=Endomicrobium trichonymphae TaxID=1408204 RepID=A0A1E5IM51_ENDTX|nr:hypothetical protein ATZ36_15885 [Candidatus Endomicrobium trichonymphae]OEG71562.1 hypothetical protein ATZ36_02635 [Candidatus Endomicrobium trichonymphae]
MLEYATIKIDEFTEGFTGGTIESNDANRISFLLLQSLVANHLPMPGDMKFYISSALKNT